MATVNFYLRNDKKTKSGYIPIMTKFSFENQTLKKNTGIKVLEKHWLVKKQRVKPNLKKEPFNNHVDYNKRLEEIEAKANAIYRAAFNNKYTLSKDVFIDQWEKDRVENNDRSIIDYFDEFIEINRPIKADRTIMGHKTARNFLANYIDYQKRSITIETFDLKVFEEIRNYAFQRKGFSDNYFSTLTGRFKIFMTWAFDRGYHQNLEFKKFKASEKPKEIICLYKEELFKLYNWKFENNRLEKVRDVYCFGCFTGLRFSDIIDLKPEHIFQDEIRKVIRKTKEFSKIPLNKYALEVLQKYKDFIYVLPKISEQKFNNYIKEACEIVGINQNITVTKYVGGKVIQEVKPKYQLITSHTARKTFTTNSLIFGMSESAVKKITGHKKDENFQRYVRLADSYLKEEINEAWS